MNRAQSRPLLLRAERLATDLRGAVPGLKKNVLLSVVADFQSERRPDLAKLRRLLELLEAGSGGHRDRGDSYGVQLLAVIQNVRALLDEGAFQPEELKTLFGWTARLLLVRAKGRSEGGPPAQRESRPAPTQRAAIAPLGGITLPKRETTSPSKAPRFQRGDKAEATVDSLEGGVYTLTIKATGQTLKVKDKGFPWREGNKCKVRITKVSSTGQILEVAP